MARQPGRWTGRAFIRGGREGIRQVSMPALVAARFNPGMKVKHQQLTGAGKAGQTRPHRRHAKADCQRQRPLVAKNAFDHNGYANRRSIAAVE